MSGGDRQLAARVGDDGYYYLTDPTGTSLTVVDQTNNSGTVLYHAYGGVLTNTLPSEMQAALTSQGTLPGADTGLVHLDEGRFYDLALGRPLPNPAGSVPTVPHSLVTESVL